MKLYGKKFLVLILIVSVVGWCLSVPLAQGAEATPPADYIDRLAAGETPGWLPPSIEELTQGKVKVGDLITKDNVELVKDYLTLSIYECVKKGMVLKMSENVPVEKIIPRFFWEATVNNKGKAVMDQEGTVRLADGANWPGGLPFPAPKTPLEAMANVKFGLVIDDGYLPQSPCLYVNKDGSIEKTANMKIWQVWAFGRNNIPPLGTVPGQEDFQWRHIAVFSEPLEMKGMGQLTIRHYDEYKKPDEGFMYIPAFKRTIRVSATTYQDNVGGMDFTYSDPQGIREPYGYWDFKTITRKLMLMPEPKPPFDWVTEDGKIDSRVEFDHGRSFPRAGWVVIPAIVIDAAPKIKHIYGRKILYMPDPPYWNSQSPIGLTDIYDRQKQLWKCYIDYHNTVSQGGFDFGALSWGIMMYDLQTGHSTVNPWASLPNRGTPLEELSLTKLLKLGR